MPLEQLLYDSVRELPVIDYHNHLSAAELRADRQFEDLYSLWLEPDPYKHRLMRICGIPEEQITGHADRYEKFAAFCRIFPMLIGTPVYEWALMELELLLGHPAFPEEDTARSIWEEAQKLLKYPENSAKGLLRRFRVEYAAPCTGILDDPDPFLPEPELAPSLRGDDFTAPDREFIEKLEQVSGGTVTDLDSYLKLISQRLNRFYHAGCRFSDHALDSGWQYLPHTGAEDGIFAGILSGKVPSIPEMQALSCELLRRAGKLYAERNIVTQLHFGAMRHTSDRLRTLAGAAGGYAGIGSGFDMDGLAAMFNDMERADGLPQCILFPLDGALTAATATLGGSFSADGKHLIREGPAWWWCDHQSGIRKVLEDVSAYGCLSVFPGMTTDSRSLLSFIRHQCFRRILCRWMAEKVQSGAWNCREEDLLCIAKKLCYENAKQMIKENA